MNTPVDLQTVNADVVSEAALDQVAFQNNLRSLLPTQSVDAATSSFVSEDATLQYADFSDGTVEPFGSDGMEVVEDGVYNPYFSQSEYADFLEQEENWEEGDDPLEYSSRDFQGNEILSDASILMQDEAYAGWTVTVPGTESDTPFPDDQSTIIYQWYNYAPSDQSSSWTAVMEITGNELWAVWRDGYGAEEQRQLLLDSVPRDEPLDFQTRIVPGSDDTAAWEIRMNGDTLMSETETNIGWGEFDDDGAMIDGALGLKMGVYAYDTADFTEGEERHLFVDNVILANNINGDYDWDTVDPDNID